nr:carbon catabolite repressor [Cryptomonas paramecium]
MLLCNLQKLYATSGFICISLSYMIFNLKKNSSKKKGLFIKFRPKQKCFRCNGFGFERCDLCKSKKLGFYKKLKEYFKSCPKCLQKKYNVCSYCKGDGKRNVY